MTCIGAAGQYPTVRRSDSVIISLKIGVLSKYDQLVDLVNLHNLTKWLIKRLPSILFPITNLIYALSKERHLVKRAR
jgi:hypothetical protein